MATSAGPRLVVGVLIAASGSLLFAQTAPPPAANPEPKLAQLAIEAARQGAVTPIPLDTSPGPAHGVLYDRFLLGVVAAKAAIAAGRTPDASSPQGDRLVPQSIAVVAYPRACDGRLSAAQSVRLSARTSTVANAPIQPVRIVSTGAAAKALLPGVTLPASSLVVAFANAILTDAAVSIDYTEPLCPATLKTVDLPVQTTPARPLRVTATAPIPADQSNLASPTAVRVQVIVDRDGSVKLPALIEGPPLLETAAFDIVKQWRFEPQRTNGIAIPQVIMLPITFTSTGRPEAPPAPPVTASSSGSLFGNDPTHNTTTPDVPGLDRASSRCDVSDDPTYAVSATNPVKVGGDARSGPTREVRYLSSLRGPAGEGLNFRRLGSTMSNQTVLDLYEITYTGQAAPLRLYLDEYHFETLKAPAGLVCAAEFGLTDPASAPNPVATRPGPPATPTTPLPENRTVALTISDDQPGLTPATSRCPVSDDDTYAVSSTNAIRIGGGAEAAGREEQYMRALRGPGGLGLKYRRTGSMLALDQKTIVDVFEVTYGGVTQPIRLYFDRGLEDAPKAPKNWACFQEIK